jgi:hypothetical protein
MKIVLSFPYKNFKSNGKSVIGDQLKDGGREANLLVGDLNEIFREEK